MAGFGRRTLATSSFEYLFKTSWVLTIAFVNSFGASTLAFVPAGAWELTMLLVCNVLDCVICVLIQDLTMLSLCRRLVELLYRSRSIGLVHLEG